MTQVRAHYGITATKLASLIPGCNAPAAMNPNAALKAAPALREVPRSVAAASSIAHCTLRGAGVLVLAFRDKSRELSAANAAYKVESYFSAGRGWIALPTSTAEQLADESVAQAVAQALAGELYTGMAYRNQP